MCASKNCRDHLSQGVALAHVLVASALARGAFLGARAHLIGETEDAVAGLATVLIEHERPA